MNIDEAKFILSAIRNEEENLSDPQVFEALKMVKNNESLKQWWTEVREFDTAVSSQLKKVPVPPGLKNAILTGVKVSTKPKPNRWFMIASVAAAACLMIGIVAWQIMNPFSQNSDSIATFRNDMIQQLKELKTLDHKSDDPNSVSLFFKSQGLEITIPGEVDDGKLAGCKIMEWKGHRVSLLCYRRDGESKADIHMFTVDASAIQHWNDGEVKRTPEGDWKSTTWNSGDKIHLVVMKGNSKKNPRNLIPLG
ncbi:MAG: hypothetical protein P1V20_06655 [Verrucomicrobiales bacterium]|nr:hypothetical protein [Verrucomicrobiales bacterium]